VGVVAFVACVVLGSAEVASEVAVAVAKSFVDFGLRTAFVIFVGEDSAVGVVLVVVVLVASA
jgi:hypothetical protein